MCHVWVEWLIDHPEQSISQWNLNVKLCVVGFRIVLCKCCKIYLIICITSEVVLFQSFALLRPITCAVRFWISVALWPTFLWATWVFVIFQVDYVASRSELYECFWKMKSITYFGGGRWIWRRWSTFIFVISSQFIFLLKPLQNYHSSSARVWRFFVCTKWYVILSNTTGQVCGRLGTRISSSTDPKILRSLFLRLWLQNEACLWKFSIYNFLPLTSTVELCQKFQISIWLSLRESLCSFVYGVPIFIVDLVSESEDDFSII